MNFTCGELDIYLKLAETDAEREYYYFRLKDPLKNILAQDFTKSFHCPKGKEEEWIVNELLGHLSYHNEEINELAEIHYGTQEDSYIIQEKE